jgi:hypothetical protein
MVEPKSIRAGMEVIASDGERIGQVESASADGILLRFAPPSARPLPLDWVTRIDDAVHLQHNAPTVRGELEDAHPPRPRAQEATAFPKVAISIVVAVALILMILAFFIYPAR